MSPLELMYKLRKKFWLYIYKKNGIKIGENCEISPHSYLDKHRPNKKVSLIKIGNNVRISRWVMIVTYDTVDTKNPSILWKERKPKYGEVIIGNNVFIGALSIILPSTKIGNNVVIGANSVVKGEIPSNVVVAGSPAEIIKMVP